MSIRIATIKNTGNKKKGTEGWDLEITQYYGGVINGPMAQLTQAADYIQLTPEDAHRLVFELARWITKVSMVVTKPNKEDK